jgi:hypothetical protein
MKFLFVILSALSEVTKGRLFQKLTRINISCFNFARSKLLLSAYLQLSVESRLFPEKSAA